MIKLHKIIIIIGIHVQNTTPSTARVTTSSTPSILENQTSATPTTSNENKKNNKNSKTDQQQQNTKQKPPGEKSNLKLNPVADWMEKNKTHNNSNKKQNNNNNNGNVKNSKNSGGNNKQGPFSKQQQKLQKAKRLEDKKQKSKKAKNNAASLANKIKPNEIINLDTDDESDSSDVIILPVEPPPTYTVDDSGDEDVKGEDLKDKVSVIIAQEENALDSTDVQMSSTSSSFIKPQQITTQSMAGSESAEKRLENSSRCTSPCSIQSSDDFIGQNDRSRLLAGASGMADDEDLLVLTSDMNSLLEVPENKKQQDENNKRSLEEIEENPLDSSVDLVQEENLETNDSLEFATPKTSKTVAKPKDYRVDQSQFRALDVYESESDITDSVYSKGANKSTVIRQIDTSSDEVEDISTCCQRTKRLRKRRASSSNKESDPNNENSASSTDKEDEDEEQDDNKLLRTNIPYIAKGPAVERKPRKRSRTLSTCSPIVQKRKAAKTAQTSGHMSDTEFIATLNNLVQGQEDELKEQTEQELEEGDESETENVPTARDIAEKILAQHNDKETAQSSEADDMAVPEDVLNDLDKVFETIDQLDKKDGKRIQFSSPDQTVQISDSSDSDREKHFVYKSLPNEDAQIIEYSPDTTSKQKHQPKTHDENGSPVYNVIYSRGQRKAGGLGWNDEMRKFYIDSWNGEHFTLNKVFQKMNPDKNLWRICSEDRFNTKSNKRHNNMKCTNCCEFGHMRSKCKRPKKPMICYMCGDSGHHEPRCPNTICLRCGNKTQVFTKSCNACSYQNRLICPICKVRGHSLDYCPDKWRRYHSTTEPNTYPNSTIDYNPRKYCCICGGRGHLSDNCRSAIRFMEYPTIISTVKSHQKSYGDVVTKTPHNGIALNLMYEPCKEYKFDLVDRTSLHKYYGRFLKAVNLGYMLKRKRNVCAATTTEETPDSSVKKAKRLSKKYEANPYSKIGTANQKSGDAEDSAPNQVQEISESGNTDEAEHEVNVEEQIINLEDNGVDTAGSDNEVDLVQSTVEDVDMTNIQLNVIKETSSINTQQNEDNFKSPKIVTSTSATPTSRNQTEPPLVLDSDSNYSFSEHFDVPATLDGNEEASEDASTPEMVTSAANSTATKSHEIDVLPDFIPLIDSTEDQNEENNDDVNIVEGISRRFVPAESDDDDEMDENNRILSPLPELPCEAKIYLTHMHSKYLLSPVGNAFLVKTSKAHKLKARLDFTSVGHVLVIFGLPTDQDKFQRELLLKYRELSDEINQKQTQSNLNVPKRTDVLIRFLRENITQLLNNLGNVNQLLKRLQFLERQQSKSGYKLAEKVRRSLNMILVGQAGLQDGTMHLDKLLMSLKTLMNDYNSEDVTPPQLRSEITDHWKVIFTPYRHENYQQLVNAYNRLISKNRMPKLVIDPILLGQKVLDTSLTEEQKRKLEQPNPEVVANSTNASAETTKHIVPNPLNQKNTKLLKRKQITGPISPSPSATTTHATVNKTKSNSRPVSPVKTLQTTSSPRGDNANVVKTKSNSNTSSPAHLKSNKTPHNTPTSTKTKISTTTTPTANKSKQSTSSTTCTAATNSTETPTGVTKKQISKIMPPPPFANPENRSTVTTAIQAVNDKWKSTCDTILTQISSDKPIGQKDGRTLDSKLPSTFWSRESMRYLDDCVRLVAARPAIIEKLNRVQNKSKNGQLSYNDYLAVIKLHTALNGK
ncbi:zinc finger CCHC-type containing 7 isoform 2-T2 [Cochliomyia hominivorax]